MDGSERKTALVRGSLDSSGIEAALSLVEDRVASKAKTSALVAPEVTRRAALGRRPAVSFINQGTSALWIYGKNVF